MVFKYSIAALKNDDWKVQINAHLEDKKYIYILCVRVKKSKKTLVRTKKRFGYFKYN